MRSEGEHVDLKVNVKVHTTARCLLLQSAHKGTGSCYQLGSVQLT